VIDYGVLASAFHFYSAFQYRRVEVPWLVSTEACFATLDYANAASAMYVANRDEYLVGSAEQGFLDIDLASGRYMAASPCFRAGEIDKLHQEYFMKLELHRTDDVSDHALVDLIGHARRFHEIHFHHGVDVVATDQGWDIEYQGIELGSYGRRQHGDRTWLYGTGVALPRLTIARGH
jgi:hypothetical protein